MPPRLPNLTEPEGRWRAALICALLLYLTTAIGIALTKAPWTDEGHLACPGFNLATAGSTGAFVLEPTGLWVRADFKGIQQYTYSVMPLHLVAQAACYLVFGFSLLTLRALSIFWGLVALVSTFVIARELTGDRRIAAFAAVLLSLDYTFLWSAADGRMDMMSAALGFAGYAAYLSLRRANLRLALLAGNALVAASMFTHPEGAIAFAGLLFLELYHDRERITRREVGIAAAPYLIGLAGWGLYIFQNPSYFVAQFLASAGAKGGSRFKFLAAPAAGVKAELLYRYLAHYGMRSTWTGPVSSFTFVIPLVYFAGVLGSLLRSGIRRSPGCRALLALTGIHFAMMAVLEGGKMSYYLAHILPLYAAVLALWTVHRIRARAIPVWLLLLGALVFLQVSTSLRKIREDRYRSDYVPAVAYLKHNLRAGAMIMGTSALGFGLGFESLIDDARLGYFSRKKPDLIVVDENYERWWNELFEQREPEVYAHITRLLAGDFRLVYENGFCKVHARRPPS